MLSLHYSVDPNEAGNDESTPSSLCYNKEGDRFYMAPEILNNPPSTAADIFSLGVTLLELASDVDLEKEKHAIRSGSIPWNWFEKTGNDVSIAITSMLEPNPASRPSAAKLLEGLQQLQQCSQMNNSFRYMEIRATTRLTGTFDQDWDLDFDEVIHSSHTPRITYNTDCRKPRTAICGFSRRLMFDTMESMKSKSMRRRRLFE